MRVSFQICVGHRVWKQARKLQLLPFSTLRLLLVSCKSRLNAAHRACTRSEPNELSPELLGGHSVAAVGKFLLVPDEACVVAAAPRCHA